MILGLPNLSRRAVNALERAGIRTVGHLERRLPEIFDAQGIGPKTRREILRRMGLDELLDYGAAVEFARRKASEHSARRITPAPLAIVTRRPGAEGKP